MRYLVTGGAGFLGSHLCERLLRDRHEVVCLDNFFTGRRQNVAHLLENPDFEIVRHDVCEPILLEIDRIFHLACPAAPVHYRFDPVKTVKTNVMGTLNMLGLAKRVRARLLQASTSEVYGDPTVHPQREEYWGNVNPIGPRSCYDEGKRVAETLCFDYHRQHDVDIRVVRIFNTYGPRMLLDDGRVVSNFIVQALCGEPLTIYGDGTQTRSFCYVDDLIDGMVRMMESDGDPGPVNLGNPQETTMRELASLVLELTGVAGTVVDKPMPVDDPSRRCPEIARARTRLQWGPTTPLHDGLVRTIPYFREALRTGDRWRRSVGRPG